MALHPEAGKPASNAQLINVAQLVSEYYSFKPNVSEPGEAVSFGTSGHRGPASTYTFPDTHIRAICQALV